MEKGQNKNIDFYELNYELGMQNFLSSEEPVINRQIKVLEDLTGRKFGKKGIKQIASCKMKDIYIVYENGKVLKNFEPYETKKVEGIFEAAPDFYYVIYKDNTVGSLYPEDEPTLSGKYDKILFDRNFLLLLRGDELLVQAWAFPGEEEVSILTVYTGVSDMELIHTWEEVGREASDEMIDTNVKIKVGDKWLTIVGVPMLPRIS
ncbi:MAG: hypothetical protein Q4B87_00705 [Candidatus Saccharibacteria bacterium]|nr:hypothetical protein [Candidatus Saccharibacteria bacterium]